MSQLSRREIISRVASGESLRGVNLLRASLPTAELTRADLSEANLRMADLENANLREARLNGCSLSGATLNGANLAGANLVEASLIGATLKGANLSRVDLSGADLTGADLEAANLSGAYLVGAFLNEANLRGADLTGAFVRMAQMAGSTLEGVKLDGADLTQSELPGVRLDGSSLVAANLTDANLTGSSLANCDLRSANLPGANLAACNLTGCKLHGVKYENAKLDDAWAEWVDVSPEGSGQIRSVLEKVFEGVLGKPLAQIMIEGQVSADVWAELLAHLGEFRQARPERLDVKLRGLHQGSAAAVLYIEADSETSLAAYLAEFADLAGTGSVELFHKLAEVVAANREREAERTGVSPELPAKPDSENVSVDSTAAVAAATRANRLQQTAFWNAQKAFAILTSKRDVWLEAVSSETLTLRVPRSSTTGLHLVRGRFTQPTPADQQQQGDKGQPGLKGNVEKLNK